MVSCTVNTNVTVAIIHDMIISLLLSLPSCFKEVTMGFMTFCTWGTAVSAPSFPPFLPFPSFPPPFLHLSSSLVQYNCRRNLRLFFISFILPVSPTPLVCTLPPSPPLLFCTPSHSVPPLLPSHSVPPPLFYTPHSLILYSLPPSIPLPFCIPPHSVHPLIMHSHQHHQTSTQVVHVHNR